MGHSDSRRADTKRKQPVRAVLTGFQRGMKTWHCASWLFVLYYGREPHCPSLTSGLPLPKAVWRLGESHLSDSSKGSLKTTTFGLSRRQKCHMFYPTVLTRGQRCSGSLVCVLLLVLISCTQQSNGAKLPGNYV